MNQLVFSVKIHYRDGALNIRTVAADDDLAARAEAIRVDNALVGTEDISPVWYCQTECIAEVENTPVRTGCPVS